MNRIVFLLLSSLLANCDSCSCGNKSYLQEKERLPVPQGCSKPPANAVSLPNGLKYVVITPGQDSYRPRDADMVNATIHGWTVDGTHFLAWRDELKPSVLPHERGPIRVASTIAQSMTEGERRRFWGHTDMLEVEHQPQLDWPRGQVCIDMEINSINRLVKTSHRPELPAELRSPPPEARVAPSGIHYVLLQKGTGSQRPRADDLVEVVASAWYLAGHQKGELVRSKLFQTTPESAPGATGTLFTMMVEGDKVRAWLPAGLGIPTEWGPRDVPMVVEIKLARVF